MEKLTLNEIEVAIGSKLINRGTIEEFYNISIDTRKLQDGDIYISICGENFNGNEYVIEASNKGASLCIVDEIKFDPTEISERTTVLLVDNTRKALLNLAKYYRMRLNIKVVGITGSTGKTSTKDLTAAVLSSKYKVFKTKGNFNNEIGLPLMIFDLDNSYDIAVLEMGMSNKGEIHNLAYAAMPDISLITNIGISHIENLGERENILSAKMEITDFYEEKNLLIVNNDNDLLSSIEEKKYKIVRIGTSSELNYTARGIISNEDSVKFQLYENNTCKTQEFTINMPGKHNVLNGLLAIATGRNFGLTFDEIQKGLLKVEATSMRLEVSKGNNLTIINDCYNASPDSMLAALEVLKNSNRGRKIAVLGTMMELGHKAKEAHFQVGEYANKCGIDLLICVGENSEDYIDGFNKATAAKILDSKEDVIEFLIKSIKTNDVILIKASRSMEFEHIVNKLESYK
ncbi:MAG: UDP-N-acetylmuramoyl-tripeptide--D-alanyl-D-alanine ligase [Clostridium sp.]